MLDRLFLKHLSKKGKIAYWVGQILLAALWTFYIFGVADQSMDNGGETTLILGVLGIMVGWGFICLMVWKKPKENENETLSNKA